MQNVKCHGCIGQPRKQRQEHDKDGHKCLSKSCPDKKHSHGHTVSPNVVPFEPYINNKLKNTFLKQFLLMVSNLTPAIAVSKLLKPLNASSFISSPLAIGAMHFTNRGTNQLNKLLFTTLSSLGITAMQKFLSMPRLFIRPLMALAVFFVERNGKKTTKQQEVTNLLKLQGQIISVPYIVNTITNKLHEANDSTGNMLKRFLGHVGIGVFQILGLSLGFIGVGKLIDKILMHFKFISNEDFLATRTEGAVCACCGAPVCVAEAASEAGCISIAA